MSDDVNLTNMSIIYDQAHVLNEAFNQGLQEAAEKRMQKAQKKARRKKRKEGLKQGLGKLGIKIWGFEIVMV